MRDRRLLRRTAVVRLTCLITSAVVSACYESSTPLSPPGEVLHDPKLMGTWNCVPDGEKTDDRATLRVVPFDETQYYTEWNENDEVTRYRAYGSRVSEAIVLNVREVELEPKVTSSWIFLRYQIDPTDHLRLSLVSKESVEGQDEAEQLDFIRTHAVEEVLYAPFALCARAEIAWGG